MGAVDVRLEVSNLSQIAVELPAAYAPAAEAAADRTVNMGEYALDEVYDENSTPTPQEVLAIEITIDNTGAYELDLSAAPIVGATSSGDPAASEDLNGKKLMHLEIQTPSTNSGAVTVKPSAANGYELFGSGVADGVVLPAGSAKLGMTIESSGMAAVDNGGNRKIAVSGTENDVVNLLMVFE